MTLTKRKCDKLGINYDHVGSDFDKYHQEQMKNSEFRKEYEKLQLQRRIASVIAQKRKQKHFSQKELAQRAQTTQSFISRVENGNVSLGLKTLQRLAIALEAKIDIVLS